MQFLMDEYMMHVMLKDDESSYSSSLNATVGVSFFKVARSARTDRRSTKKVSKALSEKPEKGQLSGDLEEINPRMSEPLLDAEGNRTSQSKSSSLLKPGKTPEFFNFPGTEHTSENEDSENPMTITQMMMVQFEEYVKEMIEEKRISK